LPWRGSGPPLGLPPRAARRLYRCKSRGWRLRAYKVSCRRRRQAGHVWSTRRSGFSTTWRKPRSKLKVSPALVGPVAGPPSAASSGRSPFRRRTQALRCSPSASAASRPPASAPFAGSSAPRLSSQVSSPAPVGGALTARWTWHPPPSVRRTMTSALLRPPPPFRRSARLDRQALNAAAPWTPWRTPPLLPPSMHKVNL